MLHLSFQITQKIYSPSGHYYPYPDNLSLSSLHFSGYKSSSTEIKDEKLLTRIFLLYCLVLGTGTTPKYLFV